MMDRGKFLAACLLALLAFSSAAGLFAQVFPPPPPAAGPAPAPSGPSLPLGNPSPVEPQPGSPGLPDPGVVAPNPTPYPATAERDLGSPANLTPFEDARIIAVIGDQVILAGDLAGVMNQILEPYKDKMPPEQLQAQARPLMKKLLEQAVETKLAYLDFLRTVPTDRRGEIEGRVIEQFNETQMADLLKRYKVSTPAELDSRLRTYGSSIRKQQALFGERVLGQQMIRKNTNPNQEVTLDEMAAHYEAHLGDYEIQAQAKWEHLMVDFSRVADHAEAYRAMAQMGNEVLRGAPLSAVARRSSQASDATEGGQRDWTTKGSLTSEVLDTALFALPVGQLSPILEDQRGFHIVRVIERRDAGRVPFAETQAAIKEAIKKQRQKDQLDKYLATLKERTRVWTIFDDEKAQLEQATRPDAAQPR